MVTVAFTLARKQKKGKTVSLREGNQMLSANDRLHYHTKASVTAFLRELASFTKPPRDHTPFTSDKPCRMIVDVKPPTKRRMDAPNFYPTVKALLDGLVDAGWLTDDNNDVIKEVVFKSTELSGGKNYIIQITLEPVRKEGI